MACPMTLCSTIVFSVLLITSITESRRCSKYHLKEWQLNSSIPFDLYHPSNDSNGNISQHCIVRLGIDYTTGLIAGLFQGEDQSLTGYCSSSSSNNSDAPISGICTSYRTNSITNLVEELFQAGNQSTNSTDLLQIVTYFSLNDTSKFVFITYKCSMSDYCDIDFVRETLSSRLTTSQVDPIQKKLVARLYNSRNTDPVKCSRNSLCPLNTPFCSLRYSRNNGIFDYNEKVERKCVNSTDVIPVFIWSQTYTSSGQHSQIDIGSFYCNTPNCGSDDAATDIFQLLTDEYSLPLNISVSNMTTTTSPTTITITSTKQSTTTSNYASNVCGHLSTITVCFTIIFFL